MNYERAIGSAMLGIIDPDHAVNLAALHSMVCEKWFCEGIGENHPCGSILDSRKSVYAQLPGHNDAIYCGKCFDFIKENTTPDFLAQFTFTDARLYNLDGTPKKLKGAKNGAV